MKYKQDLSVLPQIIGFLKADPTFIDFIKKDFVLLVPATKKNRQFQPVEVIADAISKEFCVPVIKGMIEAENHTEIKHVEKAKKIDILKSSYTYCEHPEINYHMSLGAVKNRLKIIFDEIGVGDKQGFLNKYSDYEICYGDDFSSIIRRSFSICNVEENMANWNDEEKELIWDKANFISAENEKMGFRKDQCDAWIRKCEYGNRDSVYGWEIDHIKPDSKGGEDIVSNARPLHWKNNASRQNGKLKKVVTSDGNKNINVEDGSELR